MKRIVCSSLFMLSVFAWLFSPYNVASSFIGTQKLAPSQAVLLKKVGHIGGVSHVVEVQGNHAYVNTGTQLLVMDVSNPDNPVVLGEIDADLNQFGFDLDIEGDYVYIARDELKIINISDPTSPKLVTVYNEQPIWAVTVQNNIAYVYGDNKFSLLDVSNPQTPQLLSSISGVSWGGGRAITIHNQVAYIYIDDKFEKYLWLVNVSNPAAPQTIASYTNWDDITEMVFNGSTAYLASDGELAVVDISNLTNLQEIGTFSKTGYGINSLSMSGHTIYTAGTGLLALDVTNPSTPQELGALPAVKAVDMAGNGSTLYLASQLAALQIVEASNPTNFQFKGQYSEMWLGEKMYINNNYGYALLGGEITVLDLTNPTSPTKLGSVAIPGNYAVNWILEGNYIYVTSPQNNQWHIFDVSNPAAPQLLHSYASPAGANRLLMAHNSYLFVEGYTEGIQVIIFDMSDPSSPTPMGTIDPFTSVTGATIQGNYAYFGTTYGDFLIVDISDPAEPQIVGQISNGEIRGSDMTVIVTGTTAYLSNNTSLSVVDVTNPANPQRLTIPPILNENTQSLKIKDHYLYVINQDNIRIFDITIPTEPQEVSGLNRSGYLAFYQESLYLFRSLLGTEIYHLIPLTEQAFLPLILQP